MVPIIGKWTEIVFALNRLETPFESKDINPNCYHFYFEISRFNYMDYKFLHWTAKSLALFWVFCLVGWFWFVGWFVVFFFSMLDCFFLPNEPKYHKIQQISLTWFCQFSQVQTLRILSDCLTGWNLRSCKNYKPLIWKCCEYWSPNQIKCIIYKINMWKI